MFDHGQIAAVAQALQNGNADQLYRGIERLAEGVIGFKMLTVMRYDAASSELVRVFSNNVDQYPIGGSKVKADSVWKRTLLVGCQPVLSNCAEAVKVHFDDWQRLQNLGIEAILNIPITRQGRCVGTLNFGHQQGWFTDRHVEVGVVLGALLLAALDC
ncbi:GAF domain-containing protein [Xanthomonas sp. WHRI 1810A]|uniref:GAF domain-containing protein n=1 Tax=Xanthomonas sp. WHRI 1810A TaxID=3161565 RepID=UPI0032E877E3